MGQLKIGLTNGSTEGVSNGLTNGSTNGLKGVSNGLTNGLTNSLTNGVTNVSVSSEDSWETVPPISRLQLLVFSASHEASLSRSIEQYEHYLNQNTPSAPDLAYTLGVGREHKSHRAYCVTDDGKPPLTVSRLVKVTKNVPELAFVFTGQGAQWPQMGAQLLADFPVVRESFERMEHALSSLRIPCPFNLREELLKPEADSRIQSATYSQPLCTALQCALVDLLHSLGLRATAVVGHSSGEIAAAYASGALSLHDAIIVAYNRGIC
ncbi:acyltransferase domain-containing protein, partial [Candidatus Bathyarchaeota archaeon]|nr:acyltransferase domain-containing protein [Candidatus Bathyarchaeota archaeon]